MTINTGELDWDQHLNDLYDAVRRAKSNAMNNPSLKGNARTVASEAAEAGGREVVTMAICRFEPRLSNGNRYFQASKLAYQMFHGTAISDLAEELMNHHKHESTFNAALDLVTTAAIRVDINTELAVRYGLDKDQADQIRTDLGLPVQPRPETDEDW